jgi:hypothetical protein
VSVAFIAFPTRGRMEPLKNASLVTANWNSGIGGVHVQFEM